MKRLLTTLLLSAIALTATAQVEKIAERSAKRTPAWLGISDAEHFAVSATAHTLDAAQKLCLEDVRQFIVTTVASNINSSEHYGQQQLSKEGLVTLLSQYTSKIDTKAGEMPYLSGISLSKAADTYWERRFKKGEKSYYYICHMLYPFTEAERKAAIDDFRRIDDRYNARLEAIRSQYNTFTDLSYIDQAVVELNPLIEYFFDNNRKHDAQGLQQQFMRAGDQISIICDGQGLSYYYFHLELAGRVVKTGQQPQLKSDHATEMRVVPDEEGYLLHYKPMGIDMEENRIEMIYTFGGRTLKHAIIFDPMEGGVAVRPLGIVEVELEAAKAGEIPIAKVAVSLRIDTPSPFSVKHVEVYIPKLGVARGELSNTQFEGSGTHILRFAAPLQKADVEATLIKGTLRIYNPATEVTSDVAFILPYKITNYR